MNIDNTTFNMDISKINEDNDSIDWIQKWDSPQTMKDLEVLMLLVHKRILVAEITTQLFDPQQKGQKEARLEIYTNVFLLVRIRAQEWPCRDSTSLEKWRKQAQPS